MSQQITESAIRWFNAHTEACGYLNGLKEITPKSGQDFKPFWTTTFCMLEGNPEKPRKTYISINIVNVKVVELLKPYANHLNADESRVFVTARISDIAVDPFIYGNNSASAGKLGVNWQANLISLIALKVGDMKIDLKKDTTTDYGVTATQPVTANPQSSANVHLFELPLAVSLDKKAANFEEAKSRLKDSGYRWNADRMQWCLANIALEKSDPMFNEKYAALKELGYAFSGSDKLWNIPAVPKQQSGYNKSQQNRQGVQVSQSNQAR